MSAAKASVGPIGQAASSIFRTPSSRLTSRNGSNIFIASIRYENSSHKNFSSSSFQTASSSILGNQGSGSVSPSTYFQRPSLPANTIIRFVPQQTAWIVERMGKFNRILEPGLAILIPFIDRIAYVKSLKEAAIEIPSQSAITADNVTLELDGVLYTRIFDAYKARYVLILPYRLIGIVVNNQIFSQLWCRRCRVRHLPTRPDDDALRDRTSDPGPCTA